MQQIKCGVMLKAVNHKDKRNFYIATLRAKLQTIKYAYLPSVLIYPNAIPNLLLIEALPNMTAYVTSSMVSVVIGHFSSLDSIEFIVHNINTGFKFM